MQQEESITLAYDLKSKLADHLRLGYRLRRTATSLESNQVISFNAVADNLIEGFCEKCSMENISTDIADRIASMEGLMDDLKRFIFGKKKEHIERRVDAEPGIITKLEWYQKEMPALLAAFEGNVGTVSVSGQYSPVFKDAGNLPKKLHKDNAEYKALYTASIAKVKKWEMYFGKVDSAFKPFLGSADRVDEFEATLAKLVKDQPDSYLPSFNQPSNDFLGYGRAPFADKSGFVFESPVPSGNPIQLDSPSKKSVADLISVVNDSIALMLLVEDATLDRKISEDATDPPTRGYLGMSEEIDNLVNRAVFYHPVYEENNTYVLENINHRMTYLVSALIHYLMKVLK